MGADIDSSADGESQGQNFHQKLMTASERMERMQEKMDDLESKFQEITKYVRLYLFIIRIYFSVSLKQELREFILSHYEQFILKITLVFLLSIIMKNI